MLGVLRLLSAVQVGLRLAAFEVARRGRYLRRAAGAERVEQISSYSVTTTSAERVTSEY